MAACRAWAVDPAHPTESIIFSSFRRCGLGAGRRAISVPVPLQVCTYSSPSHSIGHSISYGIYHNNPETCDSG